MAVGERNIRQFSLSHGRSTGPTIGIALDAM